MLSSKQLGQIVEARFQHLVLTKGYDISKPYGDNSKYDFILDVDNKLIRVQIKSTSTLRGNGGFQVKASYGTKTTKDRYTKEHIDYLIAYIINLDVWYIVPIKEITSPVIDVFPNKENSRGKYEKYKENWNILKI